MDTNEHQFKAVLQKEAKGTKVFVLKVSASFPSVERSSCRFGSIRGYVMMYFKKLVPQKGTVSA